MEAFFHAVQSAVATMPFPQVPDDPETAVINVHIFAIEVSGMSQGVVYINNVYDTAKHCSVEMHCVTTVMG